MKNKILFSLLIVTSASISFSGNFWIKGNRSSCVNVCNKSADGAPRGLNPLKGGTHPNNGNSFYTCAAIDNRQGYQLPGHNDVTCTVPYAGKEHNNSVFYCLCTDGPSQPKFLGNDY